MAAARGRTIRIFLPDGNAGSLQICEMANWTGKILLAPSDPATMLGALENRAEARQAGIYILSGIDPAPTPSLPPSSSPIPTSTNSTMSGSIAGTAGAANSTYPGGERGRAVVHIGQSVDVLSRLKAHLKNENKTLFWQRTAILTSKDNDLTRTHILYLESRFIELALKARRVRVNNGECPPLPELNEAEQADLDYFIEQALIMLPVVGLEFAQPSLPPPPAWPSTTVASTTTTGANGAGAMLISPAHVTANSNGVGRLTNQVDPTISLPTQPQPKATPPMIPAPPKISKAKAQPAAKKPTPAAPATANNSKKAASSSGSVGSSSNSTPTFVYKVGEVTAEGSVKGQEFVVFKGSQAKASSGKLGKNNRKIREELRSSGKLADDVGAGGNKKASDKWIFTEDVVFKTVAAAASAVAGVDTHGNAAWKLKTTGQTYQQWLDAGGNKLEQSKSQ